jgi:hypothetical protein
MTGDGFYSRSHAAWERMTAAAAEESCLNSPPTIALFRFYEELNEYLPRNQRKRDIEVALSGLRTLRSVIGSLGVPLKDIDLILVNGVSADFEHVLEGGERVSVYPVFELLNIKDVTGLRETPLRKNRFIVDTSLAALAEKMKKSGFDALWLPHISDQEIRAISIREKRIILTKRKALVQLSEVTHAVLIHSEEKVDQMQEVMSLLDIEKFG